MHLIRSPITQTITKHLTTKYPNKCYITWHPDLTEITIYHESWSTKYWGNIQPHHGTVLITSTQLQIYPNGHPTSQMIVELADPELINKLDQCLTNQ